MNPKNAGFFQPALTSRPAAVSHREFENRMASFSETCADRASTRGLDSARAAEIRGRILSGAYNRPEVIDALASCMLASGDF